MSVKNITFESGYLVVNRDEGGATRYPIKDVLRAADIPDLTIDSLTLLTKLADVVQVLTRTLQEQDVLDENLWDDYDLQYVYETLQDDLSAKQ